MAFFDRLKEARIKAGYTQEQLATKLGIAKSTLSGYESGNREPTIATMSKAMKFLSVDANFLYQDEMNELGGSPMCLQCEEFELIKKFRMLDIYGKELVTTILDNEYKRYKVSLPLSNQTSFPELPTAAHERTDIEITDEMKKHDDDIMDDEDF